MSNPAMQALGHLLTEILGNVRLEVPPWQRRYSWGEENWDAMWQSLSEVAVAKPSSQHFLGALVFQRGKQPAGMTVHHRIIDGQQRLVTLSLVLAVIQQRLIGYPTTDKRTREIEAITALLANPGKAVSAGTVKVVPYGEDRNVYVECMVNGDPQEATSLSEAFHYFKEKLAGVKESRLIKIRDGMAGRFFFAAVYLDDHDDANRIFRSLNEAGLTLAPTDHFATIYSCRPGVQVTFCTSPIGLRLKSSYLRVTNYYRSCSQSKRGLSICRTRSGRINCTGFMLIASLSFEAPPPSSGSTFPRCIRTELSTKPYASQRNSPSVAFPTPQSSSPP